MMLEVEKKYDFKAGNSVTKKVKLWKNLRTTRYFTETQNRYIQSWINALNGFWKEKET